MLFGNNSECFDLIGLDGEAQRTKYWGCDGLNRIIFSCDAKEKAEIKLTLSEIK